MKMDTVLLPVKCDVLNLPVKRFIIKINTK